MTAHPADWPEIARWRKGERERLIAARLTIPAEERASLSAKIAHALDALLADVAGKSVSLYWPFRGEPDLRPWMAELVARGATPALPVVIEKAHPLIFRAYAPGDPLEKGIWNIPIPSPTAREIIPDIVISPLVGVDPENYRLGYGGGFFDRTLAALPTKPLVIGVGYAMQRIDTIYPQHHDIPMDRIVVV